MRKNIKFLKKLLAVCTIAVFTTCLFTGCKGLVEINNLEIILAIGIDDYIDNDYSISVQFLNIDSEISNAPISSKVFKCKGQTIFNALNSLNRRIGKKFNYSHIQYIVISDDVARKGIAPIIDFSLRFNQMRPNIPLFITKNKASQILSTKLATNGISAFAIRDLINIQRDNGYTVITTNLEYESSTHRGSKNAVIGEIEVDNSKMDEGDKSYNLAGAAVLKDDKLVGYLSPIETRGLNWIRESIKSGDIVIQYPSKNKISLNVLDSSSKVSVNVDDKKVKVLIKVKSVIDEMPGNINPNEKPKVLENLQNEQNDEIESEINMVLNKAQKEFGTDIFEFGGNVFRKHNSKWKTVEKKWDQQFKNMSVDINVSSNIKQTGTVSKSPQVK